MNRAAPQPLFEVKLKGGKLWRGTEQELRSKHPNWLQYAKPAGTQQPPSSPHHAGFSSGIHPEDAPYLSGQLAQEEEDEEDGGDYAEPARLPVSTRTYQPIPGKRQGVGYTFHADQPIAPLQSRVPPRQSRQGASETTSPVYPQQAPQPQGTAKRQSRKTHAHPLLYLGLGMFAMLGFWLAGSFLLTSWTNVQNDWTYTRPFRTYSVDFVVGHNHDSAESPSHFIVQNDKGKVVIIEFPADEKAKAVIYVGPGLTGTDATSQPVTITFQRNPTTGRIDLLLHIGTMTYRYLNNGSRFTEPQS